MSLIFWYCTFVQSLTSTLLYSHKSVGKIWKNRGATRSKSLKDKL